MLSLKDGSFYKEKRRPSKTRQREEMNGSRMIVVIASLGHNNSCAVRMTDDG